MARFQLSIDNTLDTVSNTDIERLSESGHHLNKALEDKSGAGSDFLGWVSLPSQTENDLLDSIREAGEGLRDISDVIVVIGIGGSYLGSRAVIESLSHNFSDLLGPDERKSPHILFAGENIGEDYLADLRDVLKNRDFSVCVISKSGTTTEPAIAFRILRQDLIDRYGEKASERIVAITDASRGALRQLADESGYTSFIIPDDVGGRFSVLTPVGLVPIAAAGIDIHRLLEGARRMESALGASVKAEDNPAILYAATRHALYRRGMNIEILANYSPNLHYFTEWWKQLYGESEGKDGKGIFPAGVDLTTDLHSMGQLIQDGERNIFETVLFVEKTRRQLGIPKTDADLDKLNYLAGKNINEVNRMAMLGTTLAHVDGGVPNIAISIETMDPATLGELIYFFERACGISGYMLEVNPFDQPGVEAYKKNMFALLGKPGFEEESAKLNKRLQEKA